MSVAHRDVGLSRGTPGNERTAMDHLLQHEGESVPASGAGSGFLIG